MSRVSFAIVCLVTGPAALAAQASGPTPTLVFTIHAGVASGHSLWSVPKQPICNTGNTGTCSGASYDTVHIARSVGSGITAGLAVGYFPRAHLGYYGEVSFVGLSLDDACSGVYLSGGSGSATDVLCQAVAGSSITMGAASFIGGITVRAAPGADVSPFAVLGGGLLAWSQSTLDLSAVVPVSGGVERASIVVDNSPQRVSPVLAVGAGLRVRTSPGYGVRLSLEDIVARFQRLTGPVNAIGLGPVASKYYHHLALRIGLDVVLEQKRGRRY